MANRYAVASGDWSNTATWDGGTLPTSADDVYTNNFNVNVNQNIDVVSLRSTSAAGITAGGTFTFNTGGVTATITLAIIINSTSISFILITANTGTVTINATGVTVTGTNTNNSIIFNHSGACTFTLTASKLKNGLTSNTSYVLSKSSVGVLNINADVEGGSTGNVLGAGVLLNSISTTNITGNITGGNGANFGSKGIEFTNGTLNIIGNLNGGTSGNSVALSGGGVALNITGNIIGNIAIGVNITTNTVINITGNCTANAQSAVNLGISTVTLTGNITGGSSSGIVGIIISGTTSFNHIGICTGGNGGSAIGGIGNTSTILTGPFLRNNSVVANACQSFRLNALYNPYFEFRKSDNTNVTYVDEDTLNFPTELDVREGTSYASGLYTGTLAVPLPSNVRVGVATDDTVGTADLTAEDFWNYLISSGFDVGSIGERLQNSSTVSTTGAQIASYNI